MGPIQPYLFEISILAYFTQFNYSFLNLKKASIIQQCLCKLNPKVRLFQTKSHGMKYKKSDIGLSPTPRIAAWALRLECNLLNL